ncbi:hypothetical protein AB733_23095 [Photobacterium swingsii]|uniref:Uncharacterized protein n=1 Tax=Photobacterium swingsii TaxID=680026 RepID=A0A0J8XT62_9GAMM|nr:hypothetical protein [Photobacterium swingsii]KMV28564.1 hypothetical protein AB733_23095 [Photobacterium swingsii]PSW24535.1 hypothetical protein C9I94_10895 [Photobacterium swingsii]
MTDDTNKSTAREMKQEVGAVGFNAALRLISINKSCTINEAADYVSIRLDRAIEQIEHWRKHGVPPHQVDRVVELLKENKIPFGRHQLKPTNEIVAMYYWRNSN